MDEPDFLYGMTSKFHKMRFLATDGGKITPQMRVAEEAKAAVMACRNQPAAAW